MVKRMRRCASVYTFGLGHQSRRLVFHTFVDSAKASYCNRLLAFLEAEQTQHMIVVMLQEIGTLTCKNNLMHGCHASENHIRVVKHPELWFNLKRHLYRPHIRPNHCIPLKSQRPARFGARLLLTISKRACIAANGSVCRTDKI